MRTLGYFGDAPWLSSKRTGGLGCQVKHRGRAGVQSRTVKLEALAGRIIE